MLYLPLWEVDGDFQWTNRGWLAVSLVLCGLISSETDSCLCCGCPLICGHWFPVDKRCWPAIALVIFGHWFQVWQKAVDLWFPLLYVDTDFSGCDNMWTVVTLVLCRHSLPVKLIAVDAVVAGLICGPWFTVWLVAIYAVSDPDIWGKWFQ